MMNQLDVIDNDLKNLQSETKKKYNTIKDAVNEAMTVYSAFKNSKDKDTVESFPINEILKPLMLIPVTKNEKLIIIALNMIKNLLNYGYLRNRHLLTVLIFLTNLLDVPDDSIQVKLLQTMLLFITPKHLDFNSFELIEKLFTLCLQMYNSKNIIIHNTTSAALFQLSSIIFDHFIIYIKLNKMQGETVDQSPTSKTELTHFFYQKCVKLLKDFVMLSNGLRPEWAPQNINIPRNYGLDLVNMILKQSGNAIVYGKEAHQVIKKEMIPILSACFEPKSNDFLGLVRILRAATRIMIYLNDGLELVEHMLSLLNKSEQDFEIYLSIEAFHLTCAQPEVMKILNERHISTVSYFSEIVNAYLKVGKDAITKGIEKKKLTNLNPKLQKILDTNLTEFESPTVNSCHVIKAMADSLAAFTESFVVMFEKCDFKLGVPTNVGQSHDQNNYREWVNFNWKNLLKCLKMLLPLDLDEAITQNVLKTMQNLINITGSLGHTQARDSFIVALCQGCLPSDDSTNKEFSLRNIQTTKALFNIAHCLGGILDVDSWHIILNTLQRTEILFTKIKNELTPSASFTKKGSQDQDKNAIKKLVNQDEEGMIPTDLQILSSALDSLFISSEHYSNEHLNFLLKALNQLSLDYLEKNTNADQLIIEGVSVDGKSRIFGLSRTLETFITNLNRIDAFWDLAIDHYICIISSKNNLLRNQGIENLNTLIEKAFVFTSLKSEKNSENASQAQDDPEKSKKNEKWDDLSWQKTLLHPWLEVCKTRFADIKESICNSLLKLLQNNGHRINSKGWSIICSIMNEISQEPGKSTQLASKCLEMIVNDHLHDINVETLMDLILVCENLKKITKDNNISYLSLGMLWKIGDHLAYLQSKNLKEGRESLISFEEVWVSILNKLIAFAYDDHSEMRQTAIHTFSKLIEAHGGILGQALWSKVMNDMLFKLLDQILENYLSSLRVEATSLETPKFNSSMKINFEDPVKSSEERARLLKQWIDTLAILMQHLLKITKKYVNVIEKDNLNNQSAEIIILKSVFIKLKGIIMVSRQELIHESVKVLHELVLVKPEILSHIVDTVFDVLGCVKSFLVEVRQDSREMKLIINKFIPEVLDLIMELYEPNRYSSINPSKNSYSKHLFEIVDKAILYSKQAETFNAISPTKVITDVKIIYDFFEKIPSQLFANNVDMSNHYFKFMISILSSSVVDKFTDLVIRKFISIFENNVCKDVFEIKIFLKYLPQIFEKFGDILSLRSNNDFLASMVNTTKNSMPIWLYASDYFINIIRHVFGKINQENPSSNEEDVSLYKSVFSQVIDIFEKVLLNGEKNLENISKGILAEIKKDWFEMDMKFVNSIGDTIVPSINLLNQEMLWKLIHILDVTLSFYSKNALFSEQSAPYGREPATNSTISKITLEILFRISENVENQSDKESSSEEISTKRTNLAKFATKKLILKCKAILEKYIYDEKRSGSMPLARNRLLEVSYILEKLKKLRIPKGSFSFYEKSEKEEPVEENEDRPLDLTKDFENIEKMTMIKLPYTESENKALVLGSKGHLIYLMPLFADCITSNQSELKELLREIFREISKDLGVISF